MGSIITGLVGRKIFGHVLGEKGARAIAYLGFALLLLALFFGGKCTYDQAVIAKHDAKVEAKVARADAKADAKASVERRADDSRISQELSQVKETVDEARRQGRDPRAAYYECVRRQQHARAEGQPPPGC